MRSKTGADQTIKRHITQQKQQPLTKETQLILKSNTGTWHIFRKADKRTSCICSSTHFQDYNRNTPTVQKTVKQILENPDKDILGKLCRKGLNIVKNRGDF